LLLINRYLNIFQHAKLFAVSSILHKIGWFKKIQQNPVLHKHYMNNNSEIGDWLKCFFGSLLKINSINKQKINILCKNTKEKQDYTYIKIMGRISNWKINNNRLY